MDLLSSLKTLFNIINSKQFSVARWLQLITQRLLSLAPGWVTTRVRSGKNLATEYNNGLTITISTSTTVPTLPTIYHNGHSCRAKEKKN